MTPFKNFDESFEFIKSKSYKTNEYFLNIWGKKIPNCATTCYDEDLVLKVDKYSDGNACLTINSEGINRFHPNSINNKNFWVSSKKHFPFLSVCGGTTKPKNIKELNKFNNRLPIHTGLLKVIDDIVEQDTNFLEIGFGFGNIFEMLNEQCNYVGIDYTIPKFLKKHKNLFEINESGIPNELYKENYYDVIYCVNVFQHCSQKDRFDYFKQASKCLKTDGYMIFTMFIESIENEDKSVWGIVDDKGRKYTHFFNQMTEVDTTLEILSLFDTLGFKIEKGSIFRQNILSCVIRKV